MPLDVFLRCFPFLLAATLLFSSAAGADTLIRHPQPVRVSGKDIKRFSISPITQLEACKRLRYWFDNYLSPQFRAEFADGDPGWIEAVFIEECPTDRGRGEFIQFPFIGDPNKLQLEFLITMGTDSRPNTVWVLLSHYAKAGDPNFEKYEHNLKVVAYHLATGIAKPELLQR